MAKTRSLRKRRRSRRRGGLAISTVFTLAFAGFAAIAALAVTFNQLDARYRIKTQRDGLVEARVERRAHRLDVDVERYASGVLALAEDPAMRRLMRRLDPEELAARAEQIKSIFDGAIRVRLIPAGTARVDDSTRPPFTYACLDLLRRARTHQTRSPVELHAPGTPDEHLDIIEPVLAENGRTILGHIQLVLKRQVLDAWVLDIAEGAYVELWQKANPSRLIAKAGDPRYQGLTEVVSLPRKGTLWELKVWEPGTPVPPLYNPSSMSIIGTAVVLAGLLVYLLARSLSRTVRTDLDNLVDLAVATARGEKSHEYHLRLYEFKQAARKLEDMPRTRRPVRERDSAEEEMGELGLSDNPALASQDSIAVEEMDPAQLARLRELAEKNTAPAAPKAPPPRPAAPQAAAAAPAAFAGGGAPSLPPAEIFKEYDIRGIVGATLTAEHAMLIGRALGSEAVTRGLNRIAFARDGRLSGPELGAALVKGLQAAGVDVIDIGMVPTPVLYYAAHELAGGSGVVVTGSHNPPDYNGFKMMLGGETLAGEAITALRARIEAQDFATGQGGYQTQPVLKKYLERILGDVKLKRPLKVVVDCGNGVAGAVAPKLVEGLGCQVVPLYCEVDGRFPNHHPDPSQPENLKDLIEAVTVQRADVGLAFDGDGDRIGVVSGDGRVIWPDRLMMLYAADVLGRNHGAKIIYDVKCSSLLTQYIWQHGGEPLMWKTGHSLIKAKLKESGALLAGEMSGHIFFKERWYGFDDALYAAARLLEILARDPRPAREVFAALPEAVSTPELRIPLPEGEQHRFMEKLMEEADFGDANVIMIDGIRADWDYGWGLVRASNTTPCLVLRFEGRDAESLKKVQDRFREVLLAQDPNLQLPF